MLSSFYAATATAIVTALAAGSLPDAAMVISQAKSKVMHIHSKTHVSSTTEAEVEALKLAHKCDACSRTFPTQRGMKIHAARWCDGGVTQRSRRGSLVNRAVQTAKRRAAEALLSQVYVVEVVEVLIVVEAVEFGSNWSKWSK